MVAFLLLTGVIFIEPPSVSFLIMQITIHFVPGFFHEL